jgi:hypothetical protein
VSQYHLWHSIHRHVAYALPLVHSTSSITLTLLEIFNLLHYAFPPFLAVSSKDGRQATYVAFNFKSPFPYCVILNPNQQIRNEVVESIFLLCVSLTFPVHSPFSGTGLSD